MKTTVIAVCIFFASLCSTCYIGCPGLFSIFLENESEYELATFAADGLSSGFSFPDTLLPVKPSAFCYKDSLGGSGVIYSIKGYNWKYCLSATQKGILSVYIFKQEDINNLGWEYVREHNKYLVRYDLSPSDLNSLDETIYYPPTESMKNVHMYPPYDAIIGNNVPGH